MKKTIVVSCIACAVCLPAATVWVDANSSSPLSPFATEDTAAVSLEEAVAAADSLAAAGDTAVVVRVKDGKYDITDEIRVGQGIRIESLNGPSAVTVNQTTVNRRAFCVTNGVVSGFTIWCEKGFNQGSVDSPVGAKNGYGVYIRNVSQTKTAVMTNCVIEDIVATARQAINPTLYGGAVYVDNKGTLSGSIVRNNSMKAPGGGIFMGNSPLVSCCVISNNASDSCGGGVRMYPSGQLRNCLVAGNTSQNGGGGVHAQGIYTGAFSIENCTVVGNDSKSIFDSNGTANGAGGLYVNGQLNMEIVNCLVLGNSCNGEHVSDLVSVPTSGKSNTIVFHNCLVSTLPEYDRVVFENCVTADDAVFADPSSGDYRPGRNSPAIDAGADVDFATDLSGRARSMKGVDAYGDPKPDIGCYEFDIMNDVPLVRFFPDSDEPVLSGSEVSFSAEFTDCGVDVGETSYLWNFGDGTESVTEERTISHVFASPGIYTVTVSALSEGIEDVSTREDIVTVVPAGGFQTPVMVRAGNAKGVYPYSTEETAMSDLQRAVRYANHAISLDVTPPEILIGDGEFAVSEELMVTGGMRIASLNGPEFTTVRQTTLNRRVFRISHGTLSGVTVHGEGCNKNEMETDFLPGHGFGVILCGNTKQTPAVMTNCIVEGFVATTSHYNMNPSLHGGTVALNGGTSEVCDSVIRNNRTAGPGAGVFINLSGGTLRNCRIIGNTSTEYSGGGIMFHGGGNFYNCLIADNTAVSAGGIKGDVWSCNTMINNCTVVGNHATTAESIAGAQITYQLDFNINNCVVSGNLSYGVEGIDFLLSPNKNFDSKVVTVNNCRIPVFPEVKNIRLASCITGKTDFVEGTYEPAKPRQVAGLGLNMPWMTGSLDLAGNPRINGRNVDIGCFETDWVPGLNIIIK